MKKRKINSGQGTTAAMTRYLAIRYSWMVEKKHFPANIKSSMTRYLVINSERVMFWLYARWKNIFKIFLFVCCYESTNLNWNVGTYILLFSLIFHCKKSDIKSSEAYQLSLLFWLREFHTHDAKKSYFVWDNNL